MLITIPYYYSEDEQLVIEEISVENGGVPPLNAWNDKRVNSVKLKMKRHYSENQQYRCCYCQKQVLVRHAMVWDSEHIASKSRHPRFMFEPKNLAASCKDCNGPKGETEVLINPTVADYPNSGNEFLIIHPHFDNYSDCIYIRPDGKVYIPKNEKGTFTIECCNLTRFVENFADIPYSISDDIFTSLVYEMHNNHDPLARSNAKNELIRYIKDLQV